MNGIGPARTAVAFVVIGCLLLAATGCDQDVLDEIAAISGTYVGDVVTAVVTRCLQDAWGIVVEDDENHEAADPLHDHVH